MREETIKVLDAREAGTLPASITVDVSRRSVVATMPRFGPVDFAAQERALAWFREAFPDVKANTHRWCAYRGSRGHQPADQVTYRSVQGDGLVQLVVYEPHVHGTYRGEIRNGAPRWVCQECRKPITRTAARKLGLLPA